MTTQAWSTRIRHDSDANYREWRDELIARLTAVGLGVAETNITAGAGTRPGTNGEQGYAVFYLNDSLHATAPIYFRFGFGTGTTTSTPALWITLGTATNGSGVLSGVGQSSTRVNGNAGATGDTSRQSYLVARDGLFALAFKIGASASEGSLVVCRSSDSAGEPTAKGALFSASNAAGNVVRRCIRYEATATDYEAATSSGNAPIGVLPPGFSSSSFAGGADFQAVLGWAGFPELEPLSFICGALESEVSAGQTFTATVRGATRTFIGLSTYNTFGAINGGAAGAIRMCVVWD